MNPLHEKGMPLDQQLRSWSELNVEPFDKNAVHPYTRTRVILMNGIEVESIIFSHQFARNTDNLELKEALALARRVDAQQQKVINWLNPGDQTPLETTIGFEQVAVDLTAWLARHEPDPMLKQALDFALLEDFDHLYRYANLYELLDGKHAAALTQSLTEITPGRPTVIEHRHPYDDVRGHYETHTVDPLSRCHIMTIVAGEQQTMNFYMNHGPDFIEPIARGLYAEIALIEEQHVTHYESLLDPLDSWLKQLVFHKYNEVYLYWSMLQNEDDRRIKAIWELHLDMEIAQLHAAGDLLRRFEGIEPEELLPPALPDTPVTFEPNKEYVREVLATQIDLRTDGIAYVDDSELPADHRSRRYRDVVNAGGAPSEQVIDENRAKNSRDYRDETEGEHPRARAAGEGHHLTQITDQHGGTGRGRVAFLERQHQLVCGSTRSQGNRRSRPRPSTTLPLLAAHEGAEEIVADPAVRASIPDGRALADGRLAVEDTAKKTARRARQARSAASTTFTRVAGLPLLARRVGSPSRQQHPATSATRRRGRLVVASCRVAHPSAMVTNGPTTRLPVALSGRWG